MSPQGLDEALPVVGMAGLEKPSAFSLKVFGIPAEPAGRLVAPEKPAFDKIPVPEGVARRLLHQLETVLVAEQVLFEAPP